VTVLRAGEDGGGAGQQVMAQDGSGGGG